MTVKLLMIFCFLGVVAGKTPNIDCLIKEKTTFGSIGPIRLCELRAVKYTPGKTLEIGNLGIEIVTKNETDPNTNATIFEKENLVDFDIRVKFSESSLQSVPTPIFKRFPLIRSLEINHVGLRNIFQNSFEHAGSLDVLQMIGNRLMMVTANAFVGAENLKSLDLSENLISSIHHEAFSGLGNLQELGLSNNQLTILDEATFQPLRSLEWIWLDRNEIKIISANLLISSKKLRGVYLSNNKISALSTILFDQLPELEFLFLEGNNCTSQNFVGTMIQTNSNVKKELAKCFEEFRTIVPDEEERFRLRQVLRDAQKANEKCENDKAILLKRLEDSNQKLASLQGKKGK